MTTVTHYTPHLHAQLYRENSSEQEKLAWRALSMAKFQTNELILDVGCGDGRITASVKKMLPDAIVKGIDASTEMIAYCKQNFNGIENLTFSHYYSLELNDDQEWTWLTCFSTLQWIRKPETALSNFYKALKPGGKALIVTYPAESPYFDMIREVMESDKWSEYGDTSGHLAWRTTEQYRDMVKEIGFEVVKTLMEDRLIGFDSLQSFKKFIKSWVGCLINCSEIVEDKLVQDMTEKAKTKFINRGDGKLHLPYRSLILLLERPRDR